jgi:hypothetical protein
MIRRVLLLSSFLMLLSLFSGCTPIEPQSLFNSGRDARVFNSSTGRYEWPQR